MRKTLNFLPPILMVLAAGMLPASAQTTWKVLNTFHVGGDGGWDYVTVDAPNHRLFVTRSTHTQAIDEETGKVQGDIPGQIRSHGVALAPEFNRGFITDGGGPGAIIIFDLKTYAVLGKIAAMPDADGIIYDASQKVVLAVSGDGNSLMTLKPDVDPGSGKIDAPIPLGGSPEFLASDRGGQGIYQSRRQRPSCGGGPEDAQGRSALAGRSRRTSRGHGYGCGQPPFICGMSQSAEANDHERRYGRGGGLTAHRNRRGRHQV